MKGGKQGRVEGVINFRVLFNPSLHLASFFGRLPFDNSVSLILKFSKVLLSEKLLEIILKTE